MSFFGYLRRKHFSFRSLVFFVITLMAFAKFSSSVAHAATTIVRPNADYTTVNWTSTGGTHYTEVDEAITQPTAGTTTDYISSGSADQVDELEMGTDTISGDMTQVVVWAYAQNTGNDKLGISIFVNSAYETRQDIALTTSWGWVSATFTGTWTQTDLDNLRIQLTEAKVGGPDSVEVATLYAEATYTVSATKLFTALEGQTVNGTSVTGSGCPTPTGAITVAGTATAKTAGTALNACVYAAASDNTFIDTATNTISISSTATDSQGVYPSDAALVAGIKDFSVTFKTAASYTVSAATGGLTTGTSSSVTINPDTTSKLVITTNPTSVAAGSETTSYVVTRRDQFDNPTTSGTQTVNLTSDSGGANKELRDASAGGSVSSITIADSASTEDFFYYDELAGDYTIAVAFSGLTGDSKALTVNPGSTTKLVITTNPTSVAAGSETTSYVVTRKDVYDNPTTSGTQTVNLTSDSGGANKELRDTSGGGSVSSITIADSASTEDFFYYDELAGSHTISVAFGGLTGDSKALTVSVGATTKLVITTNPTSVTAGGVTTSYIVTRRDQYDNPTTSGAQTVNLTSDSGGANKELRDTSGGASISSITIADTASTEDFFYYDELAGTHSIAVAFSGLTGDSKSLTVDPDTTTKLVITTNPTSVNIDTETTAYVVTRRDVYDNPTTSGTQTVNLTSDSTGTYELRDTAAGASISSVTIADTASTEDFFYIDDTAGSWTIAVAFSGLTGDSKGLDVVSSKYWLVLPGQSFVDGTGTTGTASVTANQSFAITIYKTDGSDNTDGTYTGSHTVDFSSTATNSPNNGIAPTIPASSSVSFSSGSGTTGSSFTLTNAGETPTISASESSGPAGTSSSITVSPGVTTKLVITTNPTSVTAGSETTSYVVTRRDGVGNPTTSGTQTVNLTSDSGGVNKELRDTSSGASISSITIADSASTEDFFYYDELAGSYTITVAFSGLTGDSKALTVNPDTTTKLVITTNPTSVTAGSETTAYVVTRRDTYDNPTTSGAQTVNLTSDSGGANKELRDTAAGASISSVTIADTASTENFFYYDELAGSYTIAVAFGGLTGDSKTLTVNPDATAKLVITTNPTVVTVGSETTSYIVTRRDTYNNPTTSGTQTVNLTSDSGGANKELRDTSSGASISSITIADSASTEDFFYYDELAGSYTISVAFGGLTGDSKSLTVNPGSTTKLVITTNPTSVVAGSETTSYVVTRRDTYNNPTTSGTQTVNLTSDSGGANKELRDTAAGASISSITIADTASTEDFFYYDELAGSYTIAVAFGGLIGDSKALTVNPNTTTKLVITTNPTSVTAGSETTAYVVTRRDTYNNPTTSGAQTVNLTSDSGGANKELRDTSGGASISSITIADSVSTEDFFYYDELAGSYTIAVAFGGLTGDSKPLTVNVGATAQLVITTNPTTTPAGSVTTQYIVTRKDSVGNLTTSGTQTVNLTSDSGGASKEFRDTSSGASTSSITIANSASTEDFFYYDELAGSYTITVAFSGLTGDSKALTVNPNTTTKLVITTNPTSVSIDTETTAYVVARKDQYNNLTTSGTQTVNLTSDSTGTYELRDTSGGASISSITIADSASTEDFFYIDDTAGSWTIATAFGGLTGDSKGLLVATLDAPSSFAGTALSSTSIRWSWTDNSSVEDGFRIYDASNNLIVEIATADTTSYDETGLSSETSYERYVVAYQGAEESTSSNSDTVTTQAVSSSSSSDDSSSSSSSDSSSSSTSDSTTSTSDTSTKTTTKSTTSYTYDSTKKDTTEETTETSEPSGETDSSDQGEDKNILDVAGEIIQSTGDFIKVVSIRSVELVEDNINRINETIAFISSIPIISIQIPSIQIPEIKIPKISFSEIQLPQLPQIELPQVQLPKISFARVNVAPYVERGMKEAITLTPVFRGPKLVRPQFLEKISQGFKKVALGFNKFGEIVFDKDPMRIYNVKSVAVSDTEVVISWETNHISNASVNYGSALGVYEFNAYSSEQTTNHSIVLSDLKPESSYYFEVISKNGDYAVDAFRIFTTKASD